MSTTDERLARDAAIAALTPEQRKLFDCAAAEGERFLAESEIDTVGPRLIRSFQGAIRALSAQGKAQEGVVIQ